MMRDMLLKSSLSALGRWLGKRGAMAAPHTAEPDFLLGAHSILQDPFFNPEADRDPVETIQDFAAGDQIEILYAADGPLPVLTLVAGQFETDILVDGAVVAHVIDPGGALCLDAVVLIAA